MLLVSGNTVRKSSLLRELAEQNRPKSNNQTNHGEQPGVKGTCGRTAPVLRGRHRISQAFHGLCSLRLLSQPDFT